MGSGSAHDTGLSCGGARGLATGKLSSSLLQSAVLSRTGRRRPEAVVRAGIGFDSAVLDLGGDLVVLSTDPITGAASDAGWYSVHIACNDVAACGAEVVGILLTVLLPDGATEQQLVDLAEGAHQAAAELGIEIIGGHTEVTAAVTTPVLSATAVGRVRRDELVRPGGARAGDVLVLTKAAGLEGTSILAETFAERLRAAGVGEDVLERARGLRSRLSVVADAWAARAFRPSAMHDPTEGGVAGAAFELAEASGLGFVLDEARVPVLDETKTLARVLGCDPLRLISSGALLIAVDEARSADLVAALRDGGFGGAVVGRMAPAGGGRQVLRVSGEREIVTDAPRDELWRLLEEASAGRG
ncbi:MAG: AIR synthase family protein [Bacillota bacterium]|nr:AIR synthase family protein [Bacillota bacterium]